MHILVLNSEYPPVGGGAGNASAYIARELVARGHQVSVLTTTFGKLPRDEEQDGVRIIRLPGLRRSAHRSNALEQLLFMLAATLWGYAWALKLRPDVALAFFGAPSGVATWVWSFTRKLPYIVCLRGGDVPGFRPYDFGSLHRLLSPLLHQVWRRASAVVANSQGLRELAVAFDQRASIQVIPNGVELAAFKAPQREWTPARMLFVGRLVYQKGLDVLFEALGGLKEVAWKLTIVGDGPRRGWLKERAAQLGLGERIAFVGWLEREQLPEVFAEANLFVYPSRHEGMPNALLEAMASGLPAVATQIAGNEELVVEGETGRLVPVEDAQSLRAALAGMLEDGEKRKRMGAAGRLRVERDYGWQRVAEDYLELLEAARAG
jgi:glycosyltransferase involved in cell wall biosynthesis